MKSLIAALVIVCGVSVAQAGDGSGVLSRRAGVVRHHNNGGGLGIGRLLLGNLLGGFGGGFGGYNQGFGGGYNQFAFNPGFNYGAAFQSPCAAQSYGVMLPTVPCLPCQQVPQLPPVGGCFNSGMGYNGVGVGTCGNNQLLLRNRFLRGRMASPFGF